MSAPDLSATVMAQFKDSGADSHTTILLGAGASTTSGLPGWDEFAARLLMRSGSVSTMDAAELLVAKQDPLLVAEAAHAAVANASQWERVLRAALYEGVTALDPSPLHLAAVQHLLAGRRGDTELVTLNFDTLLEQAIADEGAAAVSRTDGEPCETGHPVRHLHGTIEPSGVADVVLTLSDFTGLVDATEPWQLAYLRAALSRGALVIAGTSYRDPDLRQWLHKVLATRPSEHAAVVLLARQGFALTKEQFQSVKGALVGQWEAIGMRPVLLEDHSDAAQIIRELRHVAADGYVAPQGRARAVWRAHADQFNAIQPRYSDQLADDAEELRSSFGEDRINVTLWLADGNGHLARWATQDRYYRNADDLRLVETGHDSRWIAGKALGSESVLFQDVDDGSTVRWASAVALAVPVRIGPWPDFVTAVLSVGLPRPAHTYEASALIWGESLAAIADAWGARLASVSALQNGSTLDTGGD